MAHWARKRRVAPPEALIVDHGLRPESRSEAARTARQAREFGVHAHVLRWETKKPSTGIEEAARIARYGLIGEWCKAHGVPVLFVAHTRDDQAETFLLRLGRGSGVDGLSAMRPRAPFPLAGYRPLELARPLLSFGRDELRAFLAARGVTWIEDPMNLEARFARTRMRAVLPILDEAGISVSRIVAATEHLARARDALDAMTGSLLAAHARKQENGAVLLNGRALLAVPKELGLRALSCVLMEVSAQDYRPRFAGLDRLFGSLAENGISRAATLHGCRIGRAPAHLRIFGPATLLVAREAVRRGAGRAPGKPPRRRSGAKDAPETA